MNREAAKWLLAWAAAVSALLAPFALWRQNQAADAQAQSRLQVNAARLAELAEQHAQLLRSAAQGPTSSLSPEEETELLRLRAEVGQLRRNVGAAAKVAERNAELAALVSRLPSRNTNLTLPEGSPVLVHWPRNALTFAGYADPMAALQTTLFAMAQGDTNLLYNSVTPNIKSEMLREDWNDHGPASEELAAAARKIAASLQPSDGFYVTGQRSPSPDLAVFDVFFDGEGRSRKFGMQKAGGEWKFLPLGSAGATDLDLHPGNSLWP